MTATEQNRDNTGDGSTNEKPRNLERRRFLKAPPRERLPQLWFI